MAYIILPSKWTRQPQYPVEIDWNNPFAENLIIAGTPASNRNIANGDLPAIESEISTSYDDGMAYASASGGIGWAVAPSSEFTIISIGQYRIGNNRAGGVFSSTANLGLYFDEFTSGQSIKLYKYDGAWQLLINTFVIPSEGTQLTLAATSSASGLQTYINGTIVGSTTGVINLAGINQAGFIYRQGTTHYPAVMKGRTGFLLFNKELSANGIQTISENPWQILKRRSRRIWVGGVAGGDVTLAAAATSQATASANLTTAIPITAAALGIGTATASLSTAIPLSGVAASVASGSGALTAQVRLSADALAQAVSAAALSSGIILTAAAVAQAAAAGTLSSAIQLIANAAAQASAPASLTAGSSGLAANAQASASASAALTIQIQLSAAAIAQAAASASLTAASSGLSAAASASASAQGNITTQIKLSAAALAEAIAVGGLTARIDLAANAITTADASAWMLTAVQLAADASVISTAAAALTGGSLSVVRYQALTVDVFPVELTVDVFPIILTADVF